MNSACVLGMVLATVAAAPDGSTNANRAAYEAAAASAGRDGDAQVRLALWCEAHAMPAERLKHLTRAVLLDPDSEKARGLLGQVKRDGKWMRADDVARAIADSPDQKALMDEYQQRRVKAADKADDQYQLALWCEEHGLEQPMLAHLHRTLQLDPGREGALRRLGYEKVGSRWVNPEVEAALKEAREAQSQADKEWKPKLEKIRAALAGRDRAKRAKAAEDLAAIDNPRAVPAIWLVFAKGGDEGRQRLAVETFGRIAGPGASKALATMAVFSPHVGVRVDAANLLRRRDPREFAGLLASMIRDEIKYRVKPVEGPGSQGRLIVEGQDANVTRRYTPLQSPELTIWPGLRPGPDGTAALPPFLASYVPVSAPIRMADLAASLEAQQGNYEDLKTRLSASMANVPQMATALANPNVAAALGGLPGPLATTSPIPQGVRFEEWRARFTAPALAQELLRDHSAANINRLGGPNVRATGVVTSGTVHIPIAAMEREARQSAMIARDQLAADVAQIEAYNGPVRELNDRATAVLKDVGGVDFGTDRKKWMDWAYEIEGRGYAFSARSESQPTPTYVEDVPIAFQPQATPLVTYSTIVAGGYVPSGVSCFAGGTTVKTLRGPRPIETIRPGDQVLTLDTATGRLDYRAVITAFHNPPNWTYDIDLGGGESVHPTGIHRFWKAGEGWVMARDIRAGDRLRTVGGVAEVVSAEKEKVQPVFNLLLAGGDNYCVGGLGVVAHDNSFGDVSPSPFDGVPATAELAAARKP